MALRLVSSAGEALPAEIGERFKRHFGVDIIDGIGSTEMLHIFLSNQPGKVRYGSTGWPVPGYDIELRGDDGLAVPDGEPGDLYIRGPSAAMMYWGNRAKTRETFQGGWTKSGDKYIRNTDGSYTYGGRSDDMLKVSGIYVSPFEVEATLVMHPAVLEAAVIGVHRRRRPDQDQGLRRAEARHRPEDGHRSRAEGLRQGQAGALQVPAADPVRGRAAEDGHRQDPALQAARAGKQAGMSVEFVELDWRGRRVRIEHQWLGRERAGRPLLMFLHEGLGSRSMWRDFPQRLCDAGDFRGLVYSRPGYGRSTPRAMDERWGVDFMHRQAHELLPALRHALGITDPPWLFGHSDGGSIALLHAAHFPDAVAGAVVLAPHVFVEDVSVQSIARTREAFAGTDLPQRLARHHDDVASAFWGWNDVWLDPAFRAWNIEAELTDDPLPAAGHPGRGRRVRHAGTDPPHPRPCACRAADGAARLRPFPAP